MSFYCLPLPVSNPPAHSVATKANPDAKKITNLHASCIAIGAYGVVLLGPSGSGKSDLALRLIDRGARLVADDRSNFWLQNEALMCRPPENLQGRIEVRGIGVLRIDWIAPIRIALAVRLSENYERIPRENLEEMILIYAVPLVILSAFETSAPIKVEMALRRLMSIARVDHPGCGD